MDSTHDDRSALKLLLERLRTRFDERGDAETSSWPSLAEPRTLASFRRAVRDAADACAPESPSQAALDRARSTAAELMVAERLLDAGCCIEREVATPTGKRVDFRARKGGATLCIHVKRAPQPTLRDALISIPSAWRAIARIKRPIMFALAIDRPLRGRALRDAVEEACAFAEQASIGDDLVLHAPDGRSAARLRALGPSHERTARLVADLSQSFDDHVPRFQATLRKAFAQFMPRSENLIVVCGTPGGYEPFVTALLGSSIERWDRRPRLGEAIAYGRGVDGFWAGSLRNQSRSAVYWTLAPHSEPLLFLRETRPRTEPSRGIQLAREVFVGHGSDG